MGYEQFFCRRQQQDNRAGRSNFEPARHGTGNGFASGRRVYYPLPDLPRIAGPSSIVRGERKMHGAQSMEGPATHLCLVSIVCRSYERKPDFAGPPQCTHCNCAATLFEQTRTRTLSQHGMRDMFTTVCWMTRTNLATCDVRITSV